MNKIMTSISVLLILLLTAVSFASPVPDTGQIKCYEKVSEESECDGHRVRDTDGTMTQQKTLIVRVKGQDEHITDQQKSNLHMLYDLLTAAWVEATWQLSTMSIDIIKAPVLSVTPTSQSVTTDAGSTNFSVSIIGNDGKKTWMSTMISGTDRRPISSGSNGTNSDTITRGYPPNTGTVSRTATTRVTATGATGCPKDVTVTQAGTVTSPILSLDPENRYIATVGGSTTFHVSNTGTGTMPWTAKVTSGVGWLRIQFGISGTNAGTITCACGANTSTSVRTGTIRVTAAGATGSPKDVTVTQAAAQPPKVLGAWPDAVWAWDKATGKWTEIPSTSNALMIAAGDVDGDKQDDMIGVWSSGLYVLQSSNGQWVKLSTSLPTWITAGDLNNDGKDDVIGSWANDGVYLRDSATGKWSKLASPAKELATGNIGGTRDDLAGVWTDGLYVRYSETGTWLKLDSSIPNWIAAGDMSGDGRADIVGSYSSGTYYRNSATGAWVKISTQALQVAVGDIDGDGRDDVIGVWSDGVWVRYGDSGKWEKISSLKPKWITTGRISEATQAVGELDDPINDGDVIDMSQDWPGSAVEQVE